jgi:hypothetical protein
MDVAHGQRAAETSYEGAIPPERNAVMIAIPMASIPTSRKEIRRRVRRQVMLRRLSRELGRTEDADSRTVLRRPFPTT